MQLEPTAERLVEEHYLGSPGNYLIYLFHVIAYDFARRHVAGKDVLDNGSGSGFGTHRLAAECTRIVGVDIAPDAVRFATERYRAPNLTFQVIAPADREPLPFVDGSFDTFLSFQVIEHVVAPGSYLAEIRRLTGRSRRAAAPALAEPPFGVEDLMIAPDASPSVNLIAVTQKT